MCCPSSSTVNTALHVAGEREYPERAMGGTRNSSRFSGSGINVTVFDPPRAANISYYTFIDFAYAPGKVTGLAVPNRY